MFEVRVVEVMIVLVVRLVMLVVLYIFVDRGKFLKSVTNRNIRYNDITLSDTFIAVFFGAVDKWRMSVWGQCGSWGQYGGH